jgi:uncharacterized membrane protein YkoI
MIPSRVLAAAILATVSLAAAAAPGGNAMPVAVGARTMAESLTLDEAVAKVEKQYGARVVRAEEHDEDGRRIYRIRLLSDDGRVFDVTVDAATGKVE